MSRWGAHVWRDAQPPPAVSSPIDWCERWLRIPGSARSSRYDSSITPWGIEPLLRATRGECRFVTFVKPVQSGGSVSGEAAICFWLATESGGDIQYNWEDDDKADDRWAKRFERILKACRPVMDRAPSLLKHDGYWKIGLVLFPHCNFIMQGVFTEKSVASDTIRFQINEEIHNWKPGRLAAADGRLTAVWNAVQFNISNAGMRGDQLHVKFESGTQQHWEVKCPGCSNPHHEANAVYHEMRTRWEDKRPKLGGLRYDADGCRLGDGEYDYNKLEKTVRYQMPCGYQICDELQARRALSLSGRYGEPKNKGARLSERSYILDGIAVDYIPWIKLIEEKHKALRALKLGDPEPYRRYVTERECRFWDPEERPVIGVVRLNTELKKNRDGLLNRAARFAAIDRQQGSLSGGELPYWWLLIRDFDSEGNSLLVYEGRLETDEQVVDVIKQHNVKPSCVVVDSGHDTMHVYQFCLRNGYNAIKGGGEHLYAHEDGGRKIFSQERFLYTMINSAPSREDPSEEPLFWYYSKSGIRDRLQWLRTSGKVKWEVPGDVSDNYKAHMESEEIRERRHPRTNQLIIEWVQVKKRNDLFVCEAYVAMLAEMAGLIGSGTENEQRTSLKHEGTGV